MNETDQLKAYLTGTLGLELKSAGWEPPAAMPAFLRSAADYMLIKCVGCDFVAAFPRESRSLPDLKRIARQAGRYTNPPIVLVGDDIGPRQRRALVAQGVPFVVPGKEAYLPFLALVAKTGAERRSYGGKLSSRAQAALVAIIARPSISSSKELGEATGMGPSSVSRAVDELSRRGLLERGKEGRAVVFSHVEGRNALLRLAKPLISTPVERTMFVEASEAVRSLPDAGESELAEKSMLASPRIPQKATSRASMRGLAVREVLEGELADERTVELQVWSYEPLVAGLGRIDDVSLAASLVGLGDERVNGELDRLFGEEGLWE